MVFGSGNQRWNSFHALSRGWSWIHQRLLFTSFMYHILFRIEEMPSLAEERQQETEQGADGDAEEAV
jgi:hypothetical protein